MSGSENNFATIGLTNYVELPIWGSAGATILIRKHQITLLTKPGGALGPTQFCYIRILNVLDEYSISIPYTEMREWLLND